MLLLTVALAGLMARWSERHPWVLERQLEGCLPQESYAFSKDGRRLLAGSDDGRILLYEFPSGRRIRTINSGKRRVVPVFSSDGRWILSYEGWSGCLLRVFDARTFRELFAQPHRPGTDEGGISADGRLLVLMSRIPNPRVEIWDVETSLRLRFPAVEQALLSSSGLIGISPDGKYLVTSEYSDRDNMFDVVWNLHDQLEVLRISRNKNILIDPSFIRFSPDGSTMIRLQSKSHRDDDTVELWNTEDWTKRRLQLRDFGIERLDGNFRQDCRVTFPPDSNVVRVGTSSGTTLWVDLQSAEVLQLANFACANRSPDGRLLATPDSVVVADTGKELFVFPKRHRESAALDRDLLGCGWTTQFSDSPLFSRDGKYILTNSRERGSGPMINVWRERHGGDIVANGSWLASVAGLLLLISLYMDNKGSQRSRAASPDSQEG
jgi:WD40 repeat protein